MGNDNNTATMVMMVKASRYEQSLTSPELDHQQYTWRIHLSQKDDELLRCAGGEDRLIGDLLVDLEAHVVARVLLVEEQGARVVVLAQMIAQYAKEVVLGLEAGELGHVGVGVVVARELLERRAEAELGRQRREVIVVDAQHDELAHLRDVVRDRGQLVVAEIETQQREREERRRHLRELVVAEIEHLEEEQRAERRRQ